MYLAVLTQGCPKERCNPGVSQERCNPGVSERCSTQGVGEVQYPGCPRGISQLLSLGYIPAVVPRIYPRWYSPGGVYPRWYSPGGVYPGYIASLVYIGPYIASLYMSRPVHARHAVIDCPGMTPFSLLPTSRAFSGEEKTVLEVPERGEERRKDGCLNPVLRLN